MILKANEHGIIEHVNPDSVQQIVNGYRALTIVGVV